MANFLKASIFFVCYQLLYLTWRVHYVEPESFLDDLEKKRPYTLSIWHGSEMGILFIARKYRLAALVSKSSDGQLMSMILSWMGVKIARGSSSRSAVSGLKKLIKITRAGLGGVFAVDGPKGPYRKIKPGIFETSRILKTRIYPTGVAVSNYWMFNKSWNRAIFPKPFATIVLVFGEPLTPDYKVTDPRSPDLSNDLSKLMHNAEQEAMRLLAQK